jgi:tape measure domain-containing protein
MAGRPIDEKIVAMKMDNSDFKQKAVETTSLFGKLRDALANIPGVNIDKVTKSFGDIQSAAQKVDLSSISSNVEKIAGRFSNLGIVAVTALTNITNKAVDAGLQVLKSFTIEPIMDGFREYETKIGAIGTVLSNTQWAGTNLDDVKRVLGDLNNYADKTIYNFGQMTENIGRFTAAGVKIDDAAIAIKGLGNLAAASGSNTEQLNTAMYQMSQALASGKLNLMDWNSLVNAGMAGKKTQDALVATAKAMGKNVDLSQGFRNSIEKGWLTSEVFLETLKKFGSDQSMTEAATKVRTFTAMMGSLKESIGSGWATTFELIFGDFNQATELWSGLYNTIGGIITIFDNARNNSVKTLADAGIFKGFFDIIIKGADAVSKIFAAIGQGISNAFSGTNTTGLNKVGSAMERFANVLTPSAETLKVITLVFQALFSVVKIVMGALIGLGKVLWAVIKIPLELIGLAIKGLMFVIGKVLAYVSSLVIAFTDAVTSGKNLSSSLGGLRGIFSAIGSVIGKVIKGISAFGSAVSDAWKILSTGDIANVGPWAKTAGIADKLLAIRNALKTFALGVKQAWNVLTKGSFDSNAGPLGASSKIVEKLFVIREAVKSFVGGVIQTWNILAKGDYVGGGPWEEDSRIVDLLFDIRENVIKTVNTVVQSWNLLTKGRVFGDSGWLNMDAIGKLLTIRKAVLDFVTKVKEAWSILTSGELTKGGPWGAESEIVAALFRIRNGAMELGKVFQDAGKLVLGFWDYMTKKKTNAKMPWDDNSVASWMANVKMGAGELGKAFANFGGAIGQAWSILSSGQFIKGPWTDNSIIVAGLYKIRDACVALGSYLSSLHFSLAPVADAFASFFRTIGKGFNWLKQQLQKIGKSIADAMPDGNKLLAGGFVAAMLAISGMVLKFWFGIANGLKGWSKLGGTLNDTLESIGGAFESFSKTMKANNTATIVLSVAIAFGILALSVKLLSTIKGEALTNSLYGLVGVMSALIGGLAIITKYDLTGAGMKTAIQMVAMGIAISIMVGALKKLSEMSMGEISKGIFGLIGIMGSLAGAMVIMSKFGGAKIGASAFQFIAIGAALYILLGVVKDIAGVDTGSLVKGISVMGIMLGELALFLKIAGGSKFSISSTLGMLAIGRAIKNIVSAIQAIAAVDTGSLVKGLTVITIILAEITAFAKLTSGSGLLSAGAGMLLMATAILALTLPIAILGNMDMKTLVQGLSAMAIALTAIGLSSMLMQGMLASGAGLILMAVGLTLLLVPLTALGAMSWGVLVKGLVGLAGILLIVGGAALLLAPAVVPLLGFAAAIGLLGLAMLLGGLGMSLFATGLVTLATMTAASITTIVATLGSLIMGISTLIPLAVNFIVNLIVQIIQAVANKIPVVVSIFAEMLIKVLNKIAEYIPMIVDAAVKIITNFLDALAQNLPKIVDSAAKLMVAFVNGLADAVDQNGPAFIAAVMRLMGEVALLVVQAGVTMIQALFGWIPGVKDATAQIGASAEQTIRDTFGAYDVGTQKGIDFANGINGQTTGANTAGANLANSGKSGASSPDFTTPGAQKGMDYIAGLNSQVPGAGNAGLNLGNSGRNGAGTPEFTTPGAQQGQQYLAGLNSQTGGANAAGNNLGQSGRNGAGSVNFNTPGAQQGQQYVNALQAQGGGASSAGANMANRGKDGASSVKMDSTGSWFGQGFASGINSSNGSVWTAAKNLAISAKNAVSNWLHINSPSRVMIEQGGWFGEGMAIGISDKTQRVAGSAGDLAKTAQDSANKFLEGFDPIPQDNTLHFKAVVDYDSLDPTKFGNISPIPVKPDTSVTSGIAAATTATNRQNAFNKLTVDSGNTDATKSLLSDIKDNITRIDPNKPVYLIVNDKVLGQSVAKNVIDNYDLKYMKAERGLADA